MNWYLKCLSNYTVFSGRARRTEYWMFCLFNCLFSIAAILLGAFICAAVNVNFNVIYMLYTLALFIPGLAVAVRRLHDTNRSGWWYLLIFIPIVGSIILIVFFCQDGTPGTNKYGLDPKGRGGKGSYFGGGSNYRQADNDDYIIQ